MLFQLILGDAADVPPGCCMEQFAGYLKRTRVVLVILRVQP